MKKIVLTMLAACIFAIIGVGATAEGEADSEETLRERLADECGTEDFCVFAYGDYDGDGISEAFAMAGSADEWGMNGDLWFVSPLFVEQIQKGKAYSMAERIGAASPMLFRAEESYGGSGSTSHLWRVENGAPVSMDAGFLESFSYSGYGYDFYSYPDAFDACDDGTGHTWKPYYFYLDTETMQVKEYGGLEISRGELETYAGAAAALQSAEAAGYEVREIIYRANGLVNVNLHSDGGYNNFLTLQLSDGAAIDVTPSENAGYYLTASTPEKAVYPASMQLGDLPSSAGESAAPSPENDLVCCYDLDGDGAQEQIRVVCNPMGEYTSYCVYIMDADGNRLGGEDVLHVYKETDEETYAYGMLAYACHGGVYLETRSMCEGVMTDHLLFLPENGQYALKKWVCDTDPSEGEYVADILLGESLLYTESFGDEQAVVSALEGAFAEYDLRFRMQDFREGRCYTAIFPEDALIFELPDEALPFYAGDDDATDWEESQTFETIGDVNMRDEPNLGGNILTTVKKGEVGDYLGEESVDDRGVVWYYVSYNGHVGWVSSRYTNLN